MATFLDSGPGETKEETEELSVAEEAEAQEADEGETEGAHRECMDKAE